jgi:signal peptide peptidase SppA
METTMPMPRPRDGESHDDFLDRCMGDQTMMDEFPDGVQRRAVCESQWETGGQATMTHYPRVLAFIREHPWAILPERLDAILGFLRLRAEGGRFTADEIAQRIGATGKRGSRPLGAVAVLAVHGVLTHRADLMTDVSGVTSTERLKAQLIEARANPAVGRIVLDVDSPGGSVFGVQELADEVFATRGRKPIVAIANSMAASAAYWIASQADEVIVTPSGEVGSIGVLAVHEDLSRALDQRGITTTIIAAGRFKGEGTTLTPLAETAKAALQARVDEYYAAFVRAVARGRGVAQRAVREGFGEGRMVGAAEALTEGMVDRIETADALLARISAGITALADATADDDRRRRRLRLAAHKLLTSARPMS